MLARLEAEIMIEELLEKVASIAPAGPPVRRLNNTLFAWGSLPVAVVPA